MSIISDRELGQIIAPFLKNFLSISAILADIPVEKIQTPILGRLLLESSRSEDILDSLGAQYNRYWAPMRLSVAISKAFSRVTYKLQYIHRLYIHDALLKIQGDFDKATQEAYLTLIKAFCDFCAHDVRELAEQRNLAVDLYSLNEYDFRSCEVEGRLKANKVLRDVENPDSTAVYLATKFLNLADEGSWLKVYKQEDAGNYASLVPNIISEARLRILGNRFHSLQSLYDTYLQGSVIAKKDKNLLSMRAHITVIFDLLDTAVTLIHYYERHAMRNKRGKLKHPLPPEKILGIIINYFVAFSDKFVIDSQRLCRNILKSYSEEGSVKLPIPNYRGFHVRPSTLIARIVTHYGSEVHMKLWGAVYDASVPLELFRANEELNRRKRDAITRYVSEHKLVRDDKVEVYEPDVMKKILRMIFLNLLEKQKIMIYDNDFSFEDVKIFRTESLLEFIKRAIALYLATGRIDIVSGDTVLFSGDKRVLEDIRILAEHGYGEDKFGNNIVLPKSLPYLKR